MFHTELHLSCPGVSIAKETILPVVMRRTSWRIGLIDGLHFADRKP